MMVAFGSVFYQSQSYDSQKSSMICFDPSGLHPASTTEGEEYASDAT